MSEYAPEYTKKERFLILLKHMAWFSPLYAITEFWFFDWLNEYAENSSCHIYGAITGTHLLMYGILVGIPFSAALILGITEGWRSIKIMKVGQNPLPDEKVFKRTKYKFGVKAKAHAMIIFIFIGIFALMSIWGGFKASEFVENADSCKQQLTRRLNPFRPVGPPPDSQGHASFHSSMPLAAV